MSTGAPRERRMGIGRWMVGLVGRIGVNDMNSALITASGRIASRMAAPDPHRKGEVCATSDGSEKEGPHHGRLVGSGYDIEYEPPHLYPPQPSSPLDGRVNTRATIRDVTWSVTLADPASRV